MGRTLNAGTGGAGAYDAMAYVFTLKEAFCSCGSAFRRSMMHSPDGSRPRSAHKAGADFRAALENVKRILAAGRGLVDAISSEIALSVGAQAMAAQAGRDQ